MDMDQLHNFDDEKEDEVPLPPGFRVYQTDEEIVEFHMRRKVEKQPVPWSLETYKEFLEKLSAREFKECYFFRTRERKCKNNISLKSSDNVVFEMDKSAATFQSGVLRNLIDSTDSNIIESIDGLDEIPMPKVSHSILSSVIEFCKKNHKFQKRVDSAVRLLKSVLDPYKDWLTRFLRNNKPILSDLQEAANYLNIPNLLEFTSLVMGDMKENTDEEISEWCCRSSILRMLSPLGIIGV